MLGIRTDSPSALADVRRSIERPPGTRTKIWLRRILIAVLLSAPVIYPTLYFFGFAFRFELFGLPARNYGRWLGPRIRGSDEYIDIGKVLFFSGADYSGYDNYKFGCRMWLRLQGLD